MLSILGIVAIVVFTIQVYKGAQNTERNAPLWAIVNAITGIAFQFVFPVFIGIAIGIYYMLTGSTAETLEREILGPAAIVGILFFFFSIAAMFLIWKHVNKVRDIPVGSTPAPPPPPTF